MKQQAWLLGMLFPLVLVAGCGRSTYEVSGTITCDGKPIEKGDIIFECVEPHLGPDAGVIVDGEYKFQAKPGKKRVVISGWRIIPGRKGMMGEPIGGNFLPTRYNETTELEAEVVPGGPNRFDFKLTEAKK